MFLVLFYMVQKEDAHGQPHLKVKIEDGREAPKKSSNIIIYYL